jgi:hypothetical protein
MPLYYVPKKEIKKVHSRALTPGCLHEIYRRTRKRNNMSAGMRIIFMVTIAALLCVAFYFSKFINIVFQGVNP